MNPPPDTLIRLAREGAHKVLAECISLKTGDVLALFWDETTSDTAKILLEAGRELSLSIRPRFVTLKEQASFSENDELSYEDREALDSARGIITCLSSHVEGTAYRKQLLKLGTNDGKRFGHMPGANMLVLANAMNINYIEASSRCDDLALALTLGKTVRLQTYVPANNGAPEIPFDLNFQIGGLLRSPITSTGIIPLGTWGNLPGGETFIAPMEDTADGIFVLNGAFKNFVIKAPAYLRLHFKKGRLVQVDGNTDEKVAFNAILDFARSHGDSFYDSLAELGIGVNPGIKELTGNALFDEKCYGTAHIAIGDSSRFGGACSSRIHEDLISRAPSLWVDDKQILNAGENAFKPAQWRETLNEWVIQDHSMNADTILTRTTINAERGSVGKLRVRRNVAAGRVCLYTVGEAATSRILASIYSFIPRLPQKIKLQDLYRTCENELVLAENLVIAAVQILLRHGLINVRATGHDEVHYD